MHTIRNSGMSLVEVVITITLFSFSILGLMELFGMSERVFTKNATLLTDFATANYAFQNTLASLTQNFNATSSFVTKSADQFSEDVVLESSSTEIEFNERLTDWQHAFGASTCDTSHEGNWNRINVTGILPLESGNIATALDVRGTLLYLTADSASRSAKDFFIVDVSDKNNPHILSSLDTGPGILSVVVAGNYAYVGNSSVSSQLQVIDIHDPFQPFLAASLKLPGSYSDETTVPISLFYSDAKLYLGTKKSQTAEFHIIDVSDPLMPRELGSYEMNTQINSITVKNSLAYLTSPDDNELQILDISDPTHIRPVSSFNAPGGTGNGKSFVMHGDTAYLGRTKGGGAELYSLDMKDPRHISSLGMATIGASINGLLAKGNLLFFITPKAGDNLQIWDIRDPARMSRLPTAAITLSATPTAMDCDKDTLYVALQSSDALRIITGQP